MASPMRKVRHQIFNYEWENNNKENGQMLSKIITFVRFF